MSNSKSTRAAFSSEAIGGWLPWGALTPFLGAALVVMALAPALLALEHFHLLGAKDDPVGLKGLCAFLLIPFTALILMVFGWVRLVERRSLATIGLAPSRAAWTYLRGYLAGLASMFVFAHLPALFVKLVDHGPVYLTGGAQGAEGSILCSAMLAAGIAFVCRIAGDVE